MRAKCEEYREQVAVLRAVLSYLASPPIWELEKSTLAYPERVEIEKKVREKQKHKRQIMECKHAVSKREAT